MTKKTKMNPEDKTVKCFGLEKKHLTYGVVALGAFSFRRLF